MAGITAYGAYVPVNRMERKQFGGGSGERAVAGIDEDSVTMAVAAGLDCLGGPESPTRPDLLYFASTTAPYREKQAASTVAGALDLPETVRSADFGDSLRAGSAAMLAALDAVQGGSARQALVTMADCRFGAQGSAGEANFGDGAAAFLFGTENVLAEVKATYHVTADLVGVWRSPGDRFVQNWEDRFAIGEGYVPLLTQAVRGVLERAGLAPGDVGKLVVYAPSLRYHVQVARELGFKDAQVQDALFAQVGSAGAAHAPMMLTAALEQAGPGQYILFATFGEGADAVVFQTTEAIRGFKPARGVSGHLARRRPITYQRYQRIHKLVDVEPARRPPKAKPSMPAAWRNRRINLAFVGGKCTACGTPQYPPQHVCVHCHTRAPFEDYRFAGKSARVTTFTADHLGGTVEGPLLVAVADFEGGGRIIMEVTDCEAKDLRIGLELELTFRRLFEVSGLNVYYWRARPKVGKEAQ